MHEASFYQQEDGGRVRCHLCRFNCLIPEGERGHCAVRENRQGILYSLVYGKVIAEQVDPVEKKPLFHLLPGSKSFSIATVGCNFRCRHCQNFSISQVNNKGAISGEERSPGEIVQRAVASGCRSIAYTYTEPTMFFEFAYDTARLARQAGLANIFVTNGYIGREALAAIAPYLDGANIDLKGFSTAFYRDIVRADLHQVLDSIVAYRQLGVWIELTTLLIPGLNDSEAELQGIAAFIAQHLGVDTPWHVTRFHPTFQLVDRPSTPAATLRRAAAIGRAAGLRYVYEGNVPGEGGENTCCPDCGTTLVRRYGFQIQSNRITGGKCPDCGAPIAGRGI